MSPMRLPLSVWAWFITSCISLTAFAVLMPTCILLILDHVAGTSFFVPSNLVVNDQLQPHAGGSTLLWQHLFWFFGHPEVYIAIVPALGIVSHILVANMRRPLLSHKAIIYSMVAIAFLSYLVYGHHMFVSGMNPYSSMAFSFSTLAITIPATVIVLIWIGSLYGSKLRINTASLFALGFISMFVSGGVSGFFLAQPSLDIMLHATYFVVGHFHLVMAVAALFGIFAGTYFWFPKVTGRMMNDTWGKIHFWFTFAGAYCIFMPFHYLGMAGTVRRYQAFVDDFMAPLMPVHRFITIAALITGAAQLLFLFNLIYSRFRGKPAPVNPCLYLRLRRSTTSAAQFQPSITTLINMASRVRPTITSCRIRRKRSIPVTTRSRSPEVLSRKQKGLVPYGNNSSRTPEDWFHSARDFRQLRGRGRLDTGKWEAASARRPFASFQNGCMGGNGDYHDLRRFHKRHGGSPRFFDGLAPFYIAAGTLSRHRSIDSKQRYPGVCTHPGSIVRPWIALASRHPAALAVRHPGTRCMVRRWSVCGLAEAKVGRSVPGHQPKQFVFLSIYRHPCTSRAGRTCRADAGNLAFQQAGSDSEREHAQHGFVLLAFH
jgi:hypothetical protein